MKRYFGVIVAVVGFIAIVYFWSSSNTKKTVEMERELNFARIQTEYLERVSWIRSNPDDKSYRDDVSSFFRWYFKEINAHVNRFQLNRDFDDYMEKLEASNKKGADGNEKRKAYYEYTRAVFDQLRTGSYAPVWTGTDKGLRLDIASAKVEQIAGKPRIRMAVVLWGANREMKEDDKTKRMVTYATFNGSWKMLDETGKLVAEMPVSGGPDSRVDYPEMFIREFPPQMLLGHYDIDLLPSNVAKLEIGFNVASRSPVTGSEANAQFMWKLDTPPEWKLAAGQAWEGATESVRPEEEINPTARK